MPSDNGTRLTGIWFLAAFILLSYSWQGNSLISTPRLSSFSLLFISGAVAFGTSLFSKWLPGADGRFDSDAVLKASSSSLPPRPRRYYIPCIIILILLRLEVSYRVLQDYQCSVSGLEAFLPLLLAAYRFFSYRPPPVAKSDEPEDMWGNPLEDFKTWLKGSPLILLLVTSLLSYSAFSANTGTAKSTYFCSSLADRGSFIVFLQWMGLFADAAIIILSWRVLSWARTTRSRLRTLGSILLITSIATLIPWLATSASNDHDIVSNQPLRTTNSLYIFDALSTGLVVATLIISGSLMSCDPSPLEPVTTATFISGVSSVIGNLVLFGTYQNTSAMKPLATLFTISLAFTAFTYTCNMRYVTVVRRVFVLVFLLAIFGSSATYIILTPRNMRRHPVDDLVYKGRVEADRWLRHATVSTTLKLAAKEYQERHHGRPPPKNFDKWFEFAQQKESVVIDRFDQIEKDLLPFWGLKPDTIREGLEFLKTQPNIGIIKISNGNVFHNSPTKDPQHTKTLDELVELISAFAQHLQPMEIAINLQERPRVLAPWVDVHRLRTIATQAGFHLVSGRLGKREGLASTLDGSGTIARRTKPADIPPPYVSMRQFRQLQAMACPIGSPGRSGADWNVRDFCASCALPHSKEQFMEDWQMSLDPCHQPDIFNLHDFHTTPHVFPIHQDLLPLFSGAKTESFNDILIPFTRPTTNLDPGTRSFQQKQDVVMWQGNTGDFPAVTRESLHGSHRLRLVHLVQNATKEDSIPMLLGIGVEENSRFRYEDVPTEEANSILPLHFSLTEPPEGCLTDTCELLRNEFGATAPVTEIDSRYVLLLDSNNGPSPDVLPTLRSTSVPVLSTIFQQWFTERLMPWVHFIPVDVRYHALHSTMSYFVGLDGRGSLNGRRQITPGRTEDAKWISEQGRKWAEKALRKEDMQVYLFRLLLEWGRVINDKRDEMGFVLKE
ncbi:hypothetical protein F5Y17DRAFT_72216 [Xylariaceae sp. FL0594]|nr:hypothetical protein F5Y17DRAFT_72216 [Xylariaceae sp. FL0594]